jgi:hypothetical protein
MIPSLQVAGVGPMMGRNAEKAARYALTSMASIEKRREKTACAVAREDVSLTSQLCSSFTCSGHSSMFDLQDSVR